MYLVLISGLSGSGKSIALKMLEDSGYYCVDNLPVELLPALIDQLRREGCGYAAVAIDVRSGAGIESLPQCLYELRLAGVGWRLLFLDARDEVLLNRYSETRRRHPLANKQRTLAEAIALERKCLESLAQMGCRIDSSGLRPAVLREWVRQIVDSDPEGGSIVLFESFGYKHGLPLDADIVFDVRCLINPFYLPQLRSSTGLDPEVVAFLEADEAVCRMRDDIRRFIADWLPFYLSGSRSYLTVAIGCTGGWHRSVYIVEWLGRTFAASAQVLVRHRELAVERTQQVIHAI